MVSTLNRGEEDATMRAFTKYLIVFLLAFAISAHIAFAGPSGGVIVAPKAYFKINIDGKLGEWRLGLFKNEQKIVLTKKNGFINSGTIDNDEDFSAVIYALYDSDNLYIGAEVTDDATENGFVGSNNWQNDCIELWIDGAGDKGTMTDRGGNDPDNYQLNIDVNGLPWVYRNNSAQDILKPIKSAASMKGTNYTLEVEIPFSAIPELDLKAKGFIGFSVSFVDSDKGVWNHILWQGEIEHEPSQWGKLEFSPQNLSVESMRKLPATWGLIRSSQ